jgi:hypothetical protein
MPPRVGQRRSCTIVNSAGTDSVTVNSQGRMDVVRHAHIDSTNVFFTVGSIGGATERYIVVDLSNTSSFFHTNTDYIHLENIDVKVDAAANAVYDIRLGFLENVDATNGDFYQVWNLPGTKGTGRSQSEFRDWAPNGFRCRSQNIISGNVTANNSAYQTDLNLPCVIDVTTASTPSGNNDVVLEVEVTAQSIGFSVNFAYHSH